ncbi:type III pantothenate kinase [Alphaproteobacteria bacterium HT1-32]|nr:type III pantothenate kinase [Alphaproteobacteria bacterium HT1-32]
MLLVIDSGNTNVVFALYDGETLAGEWRTATNSNRTADEYAVWLTQLMALSNLERSVIRDVIIANVVPIAQYNLETLCRKYFNITPLVVGAPGVELGLKVKVPRQEEVGADRLVNAVGANVLFEGAKIVIDIGTATTFDAVDDDGALIGCAIAPGPHLSLQALHMAAAKLPNVAIQRPKSAIGDSTVTAMLSGIYWGYVGLIEGIVSRIKLDYGKPMTVIGTGGTLPVFYEATDVIEHAAADLTLRGLRAIYLLNRKTDD